MPLVPCRVRGESRAGDESFCALRAAASIVVRDEENGGAESGVELGEDMTLVDSCVELGLESSFSDGREIEFCSQVCCSGSLVWLHLRGQRDKTVRTLTHALTEWTYVASTTSSSVALSWLLNM